MLTMIVFGKKPKKWLQKHYIKPNVITMMYIFSFTNKKLPPTANELKRMNMWSYKKEREYWINVIRYEMMKNKPPKPLDKYRLTLIRCSSVEPDYDNLVTSFKIVIDSAQVKISHKTFGAGLTTGDSLSNTGAWDCRWTKAKPKHGSIFVKIEAEI